ncbi:2-dehydropantoate 2-reductase [Burkholderia thailandensis]|uniref:2-dehydropantoate 2-reductase n=1 Tax=Burkholderia thailandensis TaxID=57975 RepID=UPI0003EC8304|nr:2-dehydropantoate 2-reductase [Burkholderia thailandensis]AHI64121.1 2-dehydropantoate 2-reductase family protein [Burkholderia thailandensis H0587]AOJ51735.1 2-dehydropantoate 2-reductase [Burkholderia thailandensis]AVR24078.1 2-dehydropantoate 2-reductase [Burkholderia thailandensis]TGB30700.1 2-dehydropantoate 2-reductase [Burkholderia thailandensis]
MPTICVYGAGALGCYIGGRLIAGGADVALIGRGRIGDALRAHGLVLSDYRGRDARVPPSAIAFSTADAAAASAELVLVTVKSAATPAVGAALARIMRPDAVVVSFQNGVRNADVLRAALPGATVLAGMVPFNVISRGEGGFHQGTAGELQVEAAPALRHFAEAFERAGLPLVPRADMRAVQWAKLLLNLNNAINALANRPLKEELAARSYRRCLALAQIEALRLLSAAGVRPARLTPLPAAWVPRLLSVPDPLFARLGRKMLEIDPLARSSMSDDLAAKRTTEVEWINGEIVRLAGRLGRAAPVNARLCALVHDAERSHARPAWGGDALLAELLAAARAG